MLKKTSSRINKKSELAKLNSFKTDRFKNRFEGHIYNLDYVPRVLAITCCGVQVRKNGTNLDKLESLEGYVDWRTNSLLTPKLKGCSYGDFYFYAGLIDTKYFDSREKLDSQYGDRWGLELPGNYVERMSLKEALKYLDVDIEELQGKYVERMSLKEALKFLHVDIMCDMEYYLRNRAEIEADLQRKVDYLEVGDKMMMQDMESELLYSQAVNIFGADDEDVDQRTGQKSLMFKDFRLLYLDGNLRIATAERGSFYVLFRYTTS